jgi:hypothetical protein
MNELLEKVRKYTGESNKEFPCGCESREEIMGAGEWRMDALVLGGVGLFIIGVLLYKYTSVGKYLHES